MSIPVIDIFAGPGGLGEGFCCYRHRKEHVFNIRLSIEMDPFAHQTLLLRSFYRQFRPGNVPESYYNYLRGTLAREELEAEFAEKFGAAKKEAWKATLGITNPEEVSMRISAALGRDKDNWLLIGGPPCQAYSLVGRSRIIGGKGRKEYENDHRHFLYREYLRIIAKHQPAMFVMENVKGLLSANVGGQAIFPMIRQDLENPLRVFPELKKESRRKNLNYTLYSVVVERNSVLGLDPSDFIVRSEDFGVPQARHRIIVLGVRDEGIRRPAKLVPKPSVSVKEVIGDLPSLRSKLSTGDNSERWSEAIHAISKIRLPGELAKDGVIGAGIVRYLSRLKPQLPHGGRFIACKLAPAQLSSWFVDPRLGGVCNHETRGHIAADLQRYFFAAVFVATSGVPRSPLLQEFPQALLPNHKNVNEALKGQKFNDRFRVQVSSRPSTTVVSHISKDGHYYIHYDPTQCRSLTVREAARLQTFPDNYFFEGPRTEQYHQVGNAVPPLLASQIAEIVADLFI
jgi:DNA (cytosine-5)-methyltransferase 1